MTAARIAFLTIPQGAAITLAQPAWPAPGLATGDTQAES